MAFLTIPLLWNSQLYECFHLFDIEYWWKWPNSINLYANINCLTSVRLNVRCWIWSKSHSETTPYLLDFIQILAFVSQVIDIHRSQWELNNLGGPQVSKRAPDMWILCYNCVVMLLWCCCEAFYTCVSGFKVVCNEYTVNLFTLQVLLPCLEKKVWF